MSLPIAGSASDAVSDGSETNATRGNVTRAPEPFPASAPNTKKRRTFRIKSTKQISRSTSTPQLQEVVMSDSEIDKKRNKLGYQRISIACAHCRRRKIRCLVADGDPQQRCQNCIRLKRECVFYPVDQQSALETKFKPSPPAPQPLPSVASSSPAVGGLEQPFEHRNPSLPSSLPSNMGHPYQNLSLGPGSAFVAHENYTATDYTYARPHDGRIYWNSAHPMGDMQQSPISYNPADLPIHSMWDYSRSGGDYTPFSAANTMHTQPTLPQSFTTSNLPNGHTWQQQVTESVPSNDDRYAFQQSHHHQAAPLRYADPSLTSTTGAQMLPGSQINPYLPPNQNYRPNWYPGTSSFEVLEEEGDNYLSGRPQPG